MSIGVTKDELGMFKAYIESYNAVSKSLTLVLLCSDFGLISVDEPTEVVEIFSKFYEQMSINLAQSLYDLAEIDEGRSFPHFPDGASIEIGEDYILTVTEPDAYIPATVVDPQQIFCFKYRKIILRYTYLPDALKRYPPKKASELGGGLSLAWGYPPHTIEAWDWPNDFSGGVGQYFFFLAYWNNLPRGHWRYGIAPGFAALLANNSGIDPESPYYDAVVTGVYDCFRAVLPTDSQLEFWSEGWPFWLGSRNINDSWADTYDEIRARMNFGGIDFWQRPLYWLGFTDLPFEIWDIPQGYHLVLNLRGLNQGKNVRPRDDRGAGSFGGGTIPRLLAGEGRKLFSGVLPQGIWRKRKNH
jgi:hypothetical protein